MSSPWLRRQTASVDQPRACICRTLTHVNPSRYTKEVSDEHSDGRAQSNVYVHEQEGNDAGSGG